MNGIALSSTGSTNQKNEVLVCEVFNASILVLNSLDGQLISSFSAICWGITPIDCLRFVVSSFKQELHVMEVESEFKACTLSPLSRGDQTNKTFALGVTFDQISQLIYAVDGKEKNKKFERKNSP